MKLDFRLSPSWRDNYYDGHMVQNLTPVFSNQFFLNPLGFLISKGNEQIVLRGLLLVK